LYFKKNIVAKAFIGINSIKLLVMLKKNN